MHICVYVCVFVRMYLCTHMCVCKYVRNYSVQCAIKLLLILPVRVFEYGLLRNIIGPMRDEVTGECRRVLNDDFLDVYHSANIIRLSKSKRIR